MATFHDRRMLILAEYAALRALMGREVSAVAQREGGACCDWRAMALAELWDTASATVRPIDVARTCTAWSRFTVTRRRLTIM